MGWWKIDNVQNGGIDWNFNSGSNTINAVPGKHSPDHWYNGDGPADEMESCIERITKLYKKAWKRKPTKEELQAVFNFVVNSEE